jgi:uncharacterized protein YecE (DUF72 family)
MTHNQKYYSGLSGLQLDIPQYLFPHPYQDASRLTYYSNLFNSIEINSSFYKVPQGKTVAKWSEMVNDDFKFTFKLFREITHSNDFFFSEETIRNFFSVIDKVGNKKGALLIQFPPSLGKEYVVQLNNLLRYVSRYNTADWKLAVEFRNKSWYNEKIYNLLSFYKASLVIHDIPKSATPLISLESDTIYLRFHGPTGNYRDSYPEDFLREYATYITEWIENGKTVFVYFNNTIGDAFNNLRTLNRLLNSQFKLT